MCRDRANNTISDPRPTSHFRSETTISLSETEKSRPRRRRRRGTGLVYQPRSSDFQASAHSHLSSAATLVVCLLKASVSPFAQRGFPAGTPVSLWRGARPQPQTLADFQSEGKAGLGSCQSPYPVTPRLPWAHPPCGRGQPRPSGWVGAGVVGKRSWALDSQTCKGGPPPPSWLDVFPKMGRKYEEKTSFSFPFLTLPGQGWGSLAFEKWMNLAPKHGLAVMSVQSRAAGERSRLPSPKRDSGWSTEWPLYRPMGESACWLESALRGPPCSCAHCPDHLLSVFQTQGRIEYSKQKPNHRYTSGRRGGGRHDRGRPGARSHRHLVAEAGPTDGSSCSSQYLLTVSKLCKGRGPGEGRLPSAGEAAGSAAITAPALPRGGHSLQLCRALLGNGQESGGTGPC